MLHLATLKLLLGAAGGSATRLERQQVARTLPPLRLEAFREARSLQHCLDSVAPGTFDEHVATLAAMHVFWLLIPESLFTRADPNYKRIAEQTAKQVGVHLDPASKQDLAAVYKRLRRYRLHGREASSLDLSTTAHSQLLKLQRGRCAVCRYQFGPGDKDLYLETESEIRQAHNPISHREVTLGHIVRVPVLDHIMPVFLGGDDPENWQILCHSCNAGKGASWSAVCRSGWFPPPSTLAGASTLTAAMRYVVLASCQSCVLCGASPATERRVIKIRSDRLPTFPNLGMGCEHCLGVEATAKA